MHIWKKLLYIGIVATFAISFLERSPAEAVSHRTEWSTVSKVLNKMQGDWYDDNGVKILSINGKFINACEVLAAYDFAGSNSLGTGIFRIQESTGVREIKLDWNLNGTPISSISINDMQTLHKVRNYYYESVAGIHLGMSVEKVLQTLGNPTQIATAANPIYVSGDKIQNGWYYQDKEILVNFAGRSVNGINLFQHSNLRLERSGLNCSSSMQAFKKAYNMDEIHEHYEGPQYIGHGEYIIFGKNMKYIGLTIYNN